MGTTRQLKVVGQRLPKLNAPDFVTGKAQYTADLSLPGLLYGRILRSPYAHARIRRIDTSRALALEGVKAVITGDDFPDISLSHDNEALRHLVIARGKAIYHGQPIAAVAATDPTTAQEALGLISVDYEPLPPVVTLDQALDPNAPLIHPEQKTRDILGAVVEERPSNVPLVGEASRGDVEKGLAEADGVIERTFEVARAHQGYIEPQGCVAAVDPTGQITVWTSSQNTFPKQQQLAALLGLPLSRVRVIVPEVGGAFGGKNYILVEPIAALLAQKAGRPVKLVINREEDLRASGPAPGARFRVKVGYKKDGTITAIDFEGWMDVGCATPDPSAPYVLSLVGAPYGKVPHLRIVVRDVNTNKPGALPYRAPCAPQVFFAVEQVIDEVARTLGMDPVDLRLKNATEEGDPRPEGGKFGRVGLREILRRVKQTPHYNTPLEGPNRGRGFAVGYWPNYVIPGTAHITINADGTAIVTLGSVDITGTRTVFQQIAAEELGLPPDRVMVVQGDTGTTGYTHTSAGSRTAYTLGAAIIRACQSIIAQGRQRAARKLGVGPEQVEFRDGQFFSTQDPSRALGWGDVALGTEGVLFAHGSVFRMAEHPAFSAGLADVEVDPDTGKVRLLRFTAFQDVGKALNPTRVEAQVQAAVAQGVGWALTEEYSYSPEGVLLNATLLDYRQPTAMDLPFIEPEIIEVPSEEGPYGARGVGEACMMHPLPTLANAIFDATGARLLFAPMTPERVLQALKQKG